MTSQTAAPTWITVCDTCKRADWAEGAGQTDGAKLADLVEAAADGLEDVRVRRLSCLMGCGSACIVSIQAEGKISYTLGQFTPDAEAAEGVVGYAVLHAASAIGQVPYKTWPKAIKGHFVTRQMPLPPR